MKTIILLAGRAKMSWWKNKKVLITGGCGFIGSAVAKQLVEDESDVHIIDNLERGKVENIDSIFKKIQFYGFDIRNYDVLNAWVGIINPDIVIHMASKVGGIGVYLEKPHEIMNENMHIDRNILNTVLRHQIPYYFYASSAHVYPLKYQLEPNSPLIPEEAAYPADPELSYGWAKLIAEKQLTYAVQEHSFFKVAMARFIGIYGPNQDIGLKTGSVIPVFSHRALKHPEVGFNVWGTGEETRSYCFIEDTVECIKVMVEALDNENLVGPYNVGKQERAKIKEIAEKIIEISGKDIQIEYDATKETTIWGQICDCSAIKNDLGWEAATTFEDGLRIVYEDVEKRINE